MKMLLAVVLAAALCGCGQEFELESEQYGQHVALSDDQCVSDMCGYVAMRQEFKGVGGVRGCWFPNESGTTILIKWDDGTSGVYAKDKFKRAVSASVLIW